MLEKSFGLLFYLREQRHADKGAMYIYLRITVDGLSRDLSVKRTWSTARWSRGIEPIDSNYKSLFNIILSPDKMMLTSLKTYLYNAFKHFYTNPI